MNKEKIDHKEYLKERRNSRGFWLNFFSSQRFLAIVALGLLVAVVLPLARTQNRQRAIDREIEEVKKEIAEYEGKNDDLNQMLSYLQSNSSLEEQARLNMGLKKPGEKVLVIKDDGSQAGAATAGENKGKTSNFAAWVEYFFGDWQNS
jgi:cell division protein FtsB